MCKKLPNSRSTKSETRELWRLAREKMRGRFPREALVSGVLLTGVLLWLGLRDVPAGWSKTGVWLAAAALGLAAALVTHAIFIVIHRFLSVPQEYAVSLKSEIHLVESERDAALNDLQKLAEGFAMPDGFQKASTGFWAALNEAYDRWLGSALGQEVGEESLTRLLEVSGPPFDENTGALRLADHGPIGTFCQLIIPPKPDNSILADKHKPGQRFETDMMQPLKRGFVWAAGHLDRTPELDAAIAGELHTIQYRTLWLVLYLQLALRERVAPARRPGRNMDALIHLAGHLLDEPVCYLRASSETTME